MNSEFDETEGLIDKEAFYSLEEPNFELEDAEEKPNFEDYVENLDFTNSSPRREMDMLKIQYDYNNSLEDIDENEYAEDSFIDDLLIEDVCVSLEEKRYGFEVAAKDMIPRLLDFSLDSTKSITSFLNSAVKLKEEYDSIETDRGNYNLINVENILKFDMIRSELEDVIENSDLLVSYRAIKEFLSDSFLYGKIGELYLQSEMGNVEEYRSKFLKDCSIDIKNGASINEASDVFNEFNSFLQLIGKQDLSVSIIDLPLAESVSFELSGHIEKDDVGKCVTYYSQEKNSIGLAFSKIGNDLTTKTSDFEELRRFFSGDSFIRLVGYHKDIMHSGDKVLGGGAYKVISPKTIFVDYYSIDFGPMNKGVVKECLKTEGFRMKTLNDEHFMTTPMEEYLLHKCFM